MTKFYFTDTKQEIKVGDIVYYNFCRPMIKGTVTEISSSYIILNDEYEIDKDNVWAIYQFYNNAKTYVEEQTTRQNIERFFAKCDKLTDALTDNQVKQIARILN